MQGGVESGAATLAIGEQHRRAAASGQPADQRHGQRGYAEERRELAIAGLGLLVGQDANHAAIAQSLEELVDAAPFGADLGDARVGVATHAAQKGFAHGRFRRAVEDGQRCARGQPLVEQLPVAVMRRRDDYALARGDGGIEVFGAVERVDPRQVGIVRAGPQTQCFQRLAGSGTQHGAVQFLALLRQQVGVGEFKIAPRHPALARIQPQPQPRDAVAEPAQQRPRQAADCGGE